MRAFLCPLGTTSPPPPTSLGPMSGHTQSPLGMTNPLAQSLGKSLEWLSARLFPLLRPVSLAGGGGKEGNGGGGGRSSPEPPYLLCVDIHAYSVLHSHICKKLLNPWMAWSFASSALVSRQVLTCSSISATRRRGLVSLILGVVWPLGPLFHLELPSFQLIHFSINPLLLDLLRIVRVGLTQAHMASSERKCPLSLFLPSTSYVSKTSVVTGSLSDGLHVDSQLQCLHWGLRSLHQ